MSQIPTKEDEIRIPKSISRHEPTISAIDRLTTIEVASLSATFFQAV